LAGKDQLEALKNLKKTAEPILTPEERASQVNKAEIKGQGFIMNMVTSEKGR
jgi:nickel-dependent lactate racemase